MYLHLLPFLRLIPKGKVTTYGDLAQFFGIPSRARWIGALLSKNRGLNRYPCYKVVGADGSLTGYAGGLEEKKKRLEHDGIEVVNDHVLSLDQYRWTPRQYSFFVAIPLDEENIHRFQEAVKHVNHIIADPSIIRFQQKETPHITLYYFGDISAQRQADIVSCLTEWEKNKSVKPFELVFHGLSYFGTVRKRSVGYFRCRKGEQEVIRLQQELLSLLGLWDDRPFIPHLTFFRVADPRVYRAVEEQITRSVSSISLRVDAPRVRLYGAVEKSRQIPLIDFSFP